MFPGKYAQFLEFVDEDTILADSKILQKGRYFVWGFREKQ